MTLYSSRKRNIEKSGNTYDNLQVMSNKQKKKRKLQVKQILKMLLVNITE